MCPVCGSAGSDFELADLPPDVEVTVAELDELSAADVLLMCGQCDEAFRPKFYQRCHHCGFDHESGRAPPTPPPELESPQRVLVVAVALALLCLVGLVYFWSVLR
ncbi:MAG: hypothetical protein QGG36_07510 [Pirellulaceae bacterium]|jgi:hypothetical protein|nr:hypothetical protein [Pirellulaceae bacterium]MDP7015630.1 hypothetical protein [Pirellulaceae bacterium]